MSARIILVAIFSISPLQFRTTMTDSDWSQMIQPYLTKRPMNWIFYYSRQTNVIILDSNIVKEKLPNLSLGEWIVFSSSQIRDSAEKSGDADFIKLAKFTRLSESAQVVWERVEARLSKQLHEVIYVEHEIETSNYYLTPNGWREGSTEIMTITSLGPPK